MRNATPLPLSAVRLADGMPLTMQKLVRDEVLFYQWRTLNDRTEGAARSHCVENFRIAAGLSSGEHYGTMFQDSDLYKWLEAAAYCIEIFGGTELEAVADEACALIGKAQRSDGYINTYYTLREPNGRFSNLQQGHELYCAGHLFEAAVAYYGATGKRAILETALRFADYLVRVFGTEPGQIPGYPGHQEVEIGLLKLHRATGDERYLRLAAYFIDQRGKEPRYFETERNSPGYRDLFGLPVAYDPKYAQSHARPAEQTEAVGHAVRALYMYAAMADIARLGGDGALADACRRLYQSVTNRRMYVTGGVGSTECGESFTGDFDLPNDTVYGESCASVALMMFAARMAALTGDGACYDTVERAFFNQVLGGMSQSGKEFFYVGPLSVDPRICRCNPGYFHVKPVRQRWFDVSCCPTNIARTIMSVSRYAITADDDTLYVHIPLACDIETGRFRLALRTRYPYGDILRIEARGRAQRVAIRNSGHAPIRSVAINDAKQTLTEENGYVLLGELEPGDVAEVRFDLTPRYVVSHPRVAENVGKVAVMRGPVVYCAEQADNGEGVACLRLPPAPLFREAPCFAGDGAVSLVARGARADFGGNDALYQERMPVWRDTDITLIPYCLWANRGEGEMRVFLSV